MNIKAETDRTTPIDRRGRSCKFVYDEIIVTESSQLQQSLTSSPTKLRLIVRLSFRRDAWAARFYRI